MIKPAGVPFPPKEEIQNCCDANSDGFGAMWNTSKGKVLVYKTMTKGDFLKWYEKFVKKHPASTALVCHMRIATHGSKKVENCHPWTDKEQTVGFAHNGVLQIKNRADMTDSETFFRDLWLPVYKSIGREAADKVTEACIGGSRFVFLHGNGLTVRWGNWEEGSVKGVYYSNSSWKKRILNALTPRTYSCYDGYGGYDEDDVYYGKRKNSLYMKDRIKRRMDWFLEKARWEKVSTLLARYKDRVPKSCEGKNLEDMMEETLTDREGFFPLSYLLSPWNYTMTPIISSEDRDLITELSQEFYRKFSYV